MFLLALLALSPGRLIAVESVDVLVYGATPGGIAAALSAGQDGATVLLIEPSGHIGGMVASGLSNADYHTDAGVTGAFADFAERVESYYGAASGLGSTALSDCRHGTHGEPHVNELVFGQMLHERKNILVRKGLMLTAVRTVSAAQGLRRIIGASFRGADGALAEEVSARVVIDATYEGDLMAQAGVAFRVGREGRSEYGEPLAPEAADRQLQAYNFRLIATRDNAMRVPVACPDGYRREDFVGVLPLLADGRIKRIFGYDVQCIYKAQIPELPNGKYDINDYSQGLVRLSMPGENAGWPEGDARERARIAARHRLYEVGLLWFLQNDRAVPRNFHDEAREWGWCRDEFADNGNLPWQLYVREARRMVGLKVFMQQDTDPAPGEGRAAFQPESIAMGEYGLNCHGTAHEGPRYGGRHTGEFYAQVAPYQVPYGTIVPRDVANLLVPVACSASHVGFCALRFEPIWMSLGQASGAAARIVLEEGTSVQGVAAAQVRALLHAEGAATIYVSDVTRKDPLFAAVQWLGSLGGLHGLAGPTRKYGEHGPYLGGQSYGAYLGQSFEPTRIATADLTARWVALLARPLQERARGELRGAHGFTRGELAARLFELASQRAGMVTAVKTSGPP